MQGCDVYMWGEGAGRMGQNILSGRKLGIELERSHMTIAYTELDVDMQINNKI